MVASVYPETGDYAEFFNTIEEDFPLRNGITNVNMGNFGFNGGPRRTEYQHLRLLELLGGASLHRLIPEHGKELFFAPNSKITLNYYGGDALLSNPRDGTKVLACPTADCPTLTLTTRQKGFAGIVHCGYQCLQKGIVPRVLETLKEIYSIRDIQVGLFPGICGECYEVGPEFEGGFFDEYLSPDRKLDLEWVILHQCLDHGIEEENITICDYCSAHEKRDGDHLYFSYRRGNISQRNLVFVMI